MDIKEVPKEREKVRHAIRNAIEKELVEFKKRTGLSVKYIHINMANVTTFDDELPEYILESVDCEVAIQ